MDAEKEETITKLLQQGLDHYGVGEYVDARRCWQEALALDPGNAEAREYLETAGFEGDAAQGGATPEDGAGESGRDGAHGDLTDDALRLMREGQLEAALELFETVSRRDPEHLEVQGYVEMVRSRLVQRYRKRLGNPAAALRLRISTQEVMKYNLPSAAGFLLSLVDGNTSVEELLSLSGMDTFETLRILTSLLDAGIVAADA